MNLFVTSLSPSIAATHLCDRRLRKMILETAQMLCTELTRRGHTMPYKPTHQAHPVVRSLRYNDTLSWVTYYFDALADEYVYRFSKPHASHSKCCGSIGKALACEMDLSRPTSPIFHNSARNLSLGLDFTHFPIPLAYQSYLSARWTLDSPPPTWTYRQPPDFYRPTKNFPKIPA